MSKEQRVNFAQGVTFVKFHQGPARVSRIRGLGSCLNILGRGSCLKVWDPWSKANTSAYQNIMYYKHVRSNSLIFQLIFFLINK